MKSGEPRRCRQSRRVARFVNKLVDGDLSADNHVPHEFAAERFKMLDILIGDLLRQAVPGIP